jgi:hypothetical protein
VSVDQAEEKAELTRLIAIPVGGMRAEYLVEEPSTVQEIRKKELSFVVQIAAAKQAESVSDDDEEKCGPQNIFRQRRSP